MFNDYPLQERVLDTLRSKAFSVPTPIQAATLPHALAGRDVLGQARTGTGKTLAFGLPIADRLESSSARGRAPRAFILTPTRELTLQVSGELEWLAPHLEVVTVYGGTGYSKQAASLKRGADVVVATPGRAADYYKQGVLQLAAVQIVVLDEADEMLKAGFEEEVELLLSATPEARQTMLFSATLPRWAEGLAARHLKEPVRANVTREEEVSYQELSLEAPLPARLGILSDVLHVYGKGHTIVFTRTKAEVDELAKALSEEGHAAEAVHGDLNQVQRERVLERFRSGQVTTLVATDVAARGLDIPEVDLVVHYRLPEQPESYQHRSGRTGRAGREGTVLLLHGPRERRELSFLERAVSRRFGHISPPQPAEVQRAKLEGLKRSLAQQRGPDRDAWLAVAQDWITTGDTEAVAGLLAHVLGGAPASRSLLTGEEGWVTARLGDGRSLSVPQAVRILKQAGAHDIGRVQSAPDGAYADLRPSDFERLGDPEGLRLEAATEVKAAPEQPRRARPKGPPRSRYARS